ncbi:GNAT family N-acetyltransferase [uncultured Microscilla sp.]|uniref:GNAT family N-acetyltransferase n=1 Tax=uncultured Microscilla sp. TaxID=432653 RepID=UPI0026146219|nr:GNAT family N-acetyltransferase [uncultured Microscilla sp.]
MMPIKQINIREAQSNEYKALGQLMLRVFSSLEGFPSRAEHPTYYALLDNVGKLNEKASTEILIARSTDNELLGGVVFVGNMQDYSSKGVTTTIQNASGIRLLVVSPAARGQGVGKALTEACLQRARNLESQQMILHTTQAMKVAWGMYERMGFARLPSLDFRQGDLMVYGFYLDL